MDSLICIITITPGLAQFLSAVREFATEQLCTGAWPAEADFKEYLCYSAPDLEDFEWFRDGVPEGLQLRHTYHVFKTLRSL
jgi:hypothetical protein